MIVSELLEVFLPHLVGIRIERVFRTGKPIRIQARTGTSRAACPACGGVSEKVHSRYERRLCDAAIGGQETLIHLLVARYFCRNPECGRQTFVEQVPGLTVRYGRHSTALLQTLRAIRAGARLTDRLATAVSRMTLIRIIRALPEPALKAGPQVLGVDDFALRRGHRYGTILIDITTRRPIDMLDERSADALAAWLATHPGVQIICRDRAGSYADGAARGAPEATQVADRWHMWRNLSEAVERTLAKHRTVLRELPPLTPPAEAAEACARPARPDTQPPARTGPLAERTRQRHAAIHHLLAQGRDLRAIAAELGLARNTVRRFARAATPEELLVKDSTGRRPRALDAFKPYLRRRWNDGCTNAEQLYQELRERGYHGLPPPSGIPTALALGHHQATAAPGPTTVRQATG